MNEERLKALYKELDYLINQSSFVEDCTEEENQMYSDMAKLIDSMFDAGYGR